LAGVFAQPEAAVPLAAATELACQGWLGADDTVLCVITGSGLKYSKPVGSPDGVVIDCRLEEVDARVNDWLNRIS
jgi:threonine synthase